MKNDIKTQLEKLREDMNHVVPQKFTEAAQKTIDEILNSLEPKQAYFKKGEKVAVSDGKSYPYAIKEFIRITDKGKYYCKGLFNGAESFFDNCKKIQILEEGETGIVFKSERPELSEGDKGWIIRFKGGAVGTYKKIDFVCIDPERLEDAKYAVWKG